MSKVYDADSTSAPFHETVEFAKTSTEQSASAATTTELQLASMEEIV